MITDGHHNTASGQLVDVPMIRTLGDMASSIAASDIPAARKRTTLWAVHRAIGILGNGLPDVTADRKVVLRQLAEISPAMAGLSRQSFANLKSLMRSAFRRLAPDLAPARSRTRLGPEWAALEALLPVRERCELSRIIRFSQAMGWRPYEVGEEQLEYYLEHEAMLYRPESVIRATRHAWNRVVDTVPGWPQQRLEPPPRKRTSYWLPVEQLPVSLQQDIQKHLKRLANPDPFLDASSNGYTQTTVEQFRCTFITIASALVASGKPVEQLELDGHAGAPRPSQAGAPVPLSTGWQPHHADDRQCGLARPRHRPPRRTFGAGDRRARQDAGCDQARRPASSRSHGQEPPTARAAGRSSLRRPAGHPAPSAHPGCAAETGNRQHAASCARDAVAVELLLICSMRRRQPDRPAHRRDHSQVRSGSRCPLGGRAAPGEGQEPPAAQVPAAAGVAQLIEEYLTRWQPFWSGPGVAVALPRRPRRPRRWAIPVGVDRQAGPAACRRPDHRASIPAPRRRDLSPRGPERHRHRQPAPRASRPEHHPGLLCPRADADRDPALPRRPDQEAHGSTPVTPLQAERQIRMTSTRLCLVVDDWPEIDRERWHSAQAAAGFLEADKPASDWSPARRRIVEQAYGQWLASSTATACSTRSPAPASVRPTRA